ncbi:hypothetical protein J2Z21_000890 [Streptomyces griseochromogenes]|uniref:PPM-type phosphatase domain-containing protein n=1 Tax=Streptomyces griseochromogenes TaxID=68214 RepID=A0A1B1AUV0_9ACTN|nr:protein phosphatase 2C domain-containing protein [Streptomyces griseochromogenes]ANP50354.1 hypothetical protein AVL59_12640 [Streptomyces griseochromogenes]MBP2047966.1 hypothetical protein [Streptomyces griseochromogenes]
MSQQGGSPARHEDDWWGQLYDDDSTEDTGPTAAPDSLDDRFASAQNAVTGRSGPAAGRPGDTTPRSPRQAPSRKPRREPSREQAVPSQRTASPPTTAPTPAAPPPAAPPRPGPAGPVTRPTAPAATGPAAAPPLGAVPPRQRAPWEPPPAEPAPPVTSPPAPARAGNRTEAARTPAPRPDLPTLPPPPSSLDYVGSGPPTYDPEPTALPAADPDDLDEPVPDTVLDGARYGACTLRAVSMRGDSGRYRGEPRRDALLTARFGTGEQALLLVAMATGARATPGAHLAAAEACRLIGQAVGRSRRSLVEDLRAARRGDLKSGLHRLTDRGLGRLRAGAVEQGLDPEEYSASLRCLLLPADPDCRTRVFFGVGEGGLFRLRDGEWQDVEPRATAADGAGGPGGPVLGFGSLPPETPEGDRLTMDLGIPTPPSPYELAPEPPREPFRFRASVARPGDVLVMCTGGLADPLRGEAALCAYLARRWSGRAAPGLAAFLADAQVRVKGYADDRTAAAVWEA